MVEKILAEIDAINAEDPNNEMYMGEECPKELLYGQRMTDMLLEYDAKASDALQIAARGQHIKRWEIPRSDYPMDRKGYLKWRTELKLMHGEILSDLLQEHGADMAMIEKVNDLVIKKRLKNDLETQQLEDVICLVFLKYYFTDFAQEHEEEKVISIVQKTWGKMTDKGHEMALKLDYKPEDLTLIQKALQ